MKTLVRLSIVVGVLAVIGVLIGEFGSNISNTRVPSRQNELVSALTRFRSDYQAARSNDLLQNQIRDQRNRFLCTFINGAPQV